MSPQSVDPITKLAYVLPTMQLGIIPPTSEAEETSLPSELDLRQLRLREELNCHTGPNEGIEDETQELEGEEVVELEPLPETPYPHIFVIGDAADAFGAIKAGHTAYWQAEVAARNIIRLARREAEADLEANTASESGAETENDETDAEKVLESLELECYTPGPPAIKVSLGIVRHIFLISHCSSPFCNFITSYLSHSILSYNQGQTSAYQINGVIGRKDTPEADDLDAPLAWAFFGMQDAKPEDLYQ